MAYSMRELGLSQPHPIAGAYHRIIDGLQSWSVRRLIHRRAGCGIFGSAVAGIVRRDRSSDFARKRQPALLPDGRRPPASARPAVTF
jgi:hypothetical protein